MCFCNSVVRAEARRGARKSHRQLASLIPPYFLPIIEWQTLKVPGGVQARREGYEKQPKPLADSHRPTLQLSCALHLADVALLEPGEKPERGPPFANAPDQLSQPPIEKAQPGDATPEQARSQIHWHAWHSHFAGPSPLPFALVCTANDVSGLLLCRAARHQRAGVHGQALVCAQAGEPGNFGAKVLYGCQRQASFLIGVCTQDRLSRLPKLLQWLPRATKAVDEYNSEKKTQLEAAIEVGDSPLRHTSPFKYTVLRE